MAKMTQEMGQQVLGFKKQEDLNPCLNRHEEEIAQYRTSIMDYSREIARVGTKKGG